MVQTTLKTMPKPPATKKRPKPVDSDEENEDPSEIDGSSRNVSGLSSTPPGAKKQKKAPGKKTATDQYQKLTQLEHIIKRPDTYIGSVERTTEQMWGMLFIRPSDRDILANISSLQFRDYPDGASKGLIRAWFIQDLR